MKYERWDAVTAFCLLAVAPPQRVAVVALVTVASKGKSGRNFDERTIEMDGRTDEQR